MVTSIIKQDAHKTQFAGVEGCLLEWMFLSQESDRKRKCENSLCNYILFTEAFNIQNKKFPREVPSVGKGRNGKLVMSF